MGFTVGMYGPLRKQLRAMNIINYTAARAQVMERAMDKNQMKAAIMVLNMLQRQFIHVKS